ncbi:CDP-glucose 4,6-dehydratase [Mucilaginibacter rubeus]|uniref:CDP-glucose 4,6-dehydratase n=1 Tax=Mucilaginibacter rubeus TaxID=2027860 RepID=A0AAE6JAN9_9SPHI|nr:MULTISPECIES: CDP-glucose 4,6-dehydratase [Mucilaginibacter]QEM02041.1 CDP-glucose 4,6-dehydratase [Mucilaginibacter rubeus]QEM14666.1 CDP-glucose 4,6-dehydratase [Mucilaginibacter gossypii]QTE42626.1 CDP-glucose 4,6-dehydratase [Mucilaginibacter rubeus]QTE49227.1 CDP-glucose 4,6-dehydratase [Mucilaginibacter rubeus]QTE54324.1 CDP-glucose 4,6-dehydratase [Mucilaginibacter rubeus]
MENLFNGFYKNRKVLVTGHTGFKGSWLCLVLNRLGAKVYGYSLPSPTTPSLFSIARVNELVTSEINDIRNYNALAKFMDEVQPEVVIHMAAQPLVRESYKNPVETYEVNVMGTVNLLQAIRNTKSVKAVVNVTTDKCYENKEWVWGYREDEPMGGYDPYSNSKGCSELVTSSFRNSFFNPEAYSQHGVGVASGRAGNVIGGGDWAVDRLIPDFIRAITNNEKVVIRNPNAIRPWQHVLEPLSGYLTLAEKLYQDGVKYAEGWNFGPDDSDAKNVGWIIDKICSLWGDGAQFGLDTGNNPHEANYLKLDCSKAKTLLGWYPKWGIETALGNIVEWTKAYRDNMDMKEVSYKQIERYFLG